MLYFYMMEGMRVFFLVSSIQTLIHFPGHFFKIKHPPIILPSNVITSVGFSITWETETLDYSNTLAQEIFGRKTAK